MRTLEQLDVENRRVLVRVECRARWGAYVCVGRRPIREIMAEFPEWRGRRVGARRGDGRVAEVERRARQLLRVDDVPQEQGGAGRAHRGPGARASAHKV